MYISTYIDYSCASLDDNASNTISFNCLYVFLLLYFNRVLTYLYVRPEFHDIIKNFANDEFNNVA